MWHPGEGRVVVQQVGSDGTLGTGTLALGEDGVEETIQTFFSPSGTETRGRHLARVENGAHLTESFTWAEDAWKANRTYVWRLDADRGAWDPGDADLLCVSNRRGR
jgi:hypothetical protein